MTKAALRGAAFLLHVFALLESDEHHVLGLEALGARFHLELNFAAFLQSPVAGHLDRAEMDEDVFPRLPLNEAVTLRGIKPFNNTFLFHYWFSCLMRPLPDTPPSDKNAAFALQSVEALSKIQKGRDVLLRSVTPSMPEVRVPRQPPHPMPEDFHCQIAGNALTDLQPH